MLRRSSAAPSDHIRAQSKNLFHLPCIVFRLILIAHPAPEFLLISRIGKNAEQTFLGKGLLFQQLPQVQRSCSAVKAKSIYCFQLSHHTDNFTHSIAILRVSHGIHRKLCNYTIVYTLLFAVCRNRRNPLCFRKGFKYKNPNPLLHKDINQKPVLI